ncbi:MAG: DUF6261 family protein [Planctomycetaceae bacterium]|jgi:hypothetical protein|nr:DUF6261 family protein [Planctomycetaceae bacterium]
MIKFTVLAFRTLPNEAHYRFFERATREINQAGYYVMSALGQLVPELNDWFVKETACIEWYRKSALTAEIADADHHLDNALVGFAAQVNGARYSSIIAEATAAEHLHIMLKSYGKVISKPYLQEVGAVEAILVHLTGDLALDVQTVKLTEWIPEIQSALITFISLMEQREAQTLNKPEQSFPEVRRGIEDVWHNIVILVDSGAALNTSPEFAMLIDKLNPEIEYLNKEFHRAKHNIAHAEPAPIKQQPYTGVPCTLVPEVLYPTEKETFRLELGKDFNITYKNNIHVGNAECTIHGKGKYKGHKTVTFIIARGVGND